MNDTINRYLAILCYPFASLEFFRKDYFKEIIEAKCEKQEKNRKTSDRVKKLEKILYDNVIGHMQNQYTIYSYDEIYMYLEKCYLFDIRTGDVSSSLDLYLQCFHKIMNAMISQRDGKVVFKYWKNSHDESFLGGFGDENKIFLFHSMSMHIPLDFVVMLYMARNPRNTAECLDNYYSQIEAADQQLDIILKTGVAENHMHKGVSISFFEIWEALMTPITSYSLEIFKGLNLSMGNGGAEDAEVLFFVLAAAITRIRIALELRNYFTDEGSAPKRCNYFDANVEGKKDAEEIKELEFLMCSFGKGEDLEELFRECLGDAGKKKVKAEIFTFFQKQWDTLLQILSEHDNERTWMQELFGVPSDIHTSDENIFLFYAMKYLSEQEEKHFPEEGRQTAEWILQYLRIRNYVFGCTVQKKTIRGLDYFQQKYYGKDSGMNKFGGRIAGIGKMGEENTIYWEQAMRKQFQNRYLKKIEFRASINKNENYFRRDVRAFLEAYRNIIEEDYCVKEEGMYKVCREIPRVGLIFHFIKRKDETIPEKCFLDGVEEREKILFGALEKEYDEAVELMRKLREEIPGLDRFIVGIDAASLENSTPVWAFAKVYNKARDSSIEKIGYERIGTQSLRFTFHAGEEFRHILSGLRRVDEAVTFLKFHAGDRIGHGTALGIVPEQWRRVNPFVVLPRIEALENYIWAYYVLSQDAVNFQSTLMAYLERRVYELAGEIYGKAQGISMQVLMQGYLKMFDTAGDGAYERCRFAEKNGFCEYVQGENCDEILWSGEKLALARHCKRFVLRMERPINYEVTEQDIQITKTLQKMLCRKLSRRGIVVEVNPSSNVAIGEVDKITDNQIYRLNRPEGEDNVMVCINSDDPTVFHTNVSNELAYIYYGMLYHAKSREAALAWIDKVRECGVKSSFVQVSETDQVMYEMVRGILEIL
mgnify:CR=1 FL=1